MFPQVIASLALDGARHMFNTNRCCTWAEYIAQSGVGQTPAVSLRGQKSCVCRVSAKRLTVTQLAHSRLRTSKCRAVRLARDPSTNEHLDHKHSDLATHCCLKQSVSDSPFLGSQSVSRRSAGLVAACALLQVRLLPLGNLCFLY